MSVTANRAESAKAKTVKAIGFKLRAAAFLIDAAFVWFLGMLLGTVVGVVGMLLATFTKDDPPPIDVLVILAGLVFSVAYFVVAWSRSGQTVGKMTVGIKVVGADGQPPTGGRALLRYVGYALSGLVLSLGFLWVIFDRKRQGWHDKIAGTYVVYSDEEFSEGDRVRVEPADQKPGWAWLVLWVLLALAVPPALVAAVFGLGPYVSRLLVSLFGG